MEKITERSGVAAPRCAVCGGPGPDGSGCEHCPAVELPEYTAEIDYDLFGKEWVIRVRYAVPAGSRKRYKSFLLVPHQGEMFSEVCNTIGAALRAYLAKTA